MGKALTILCVVLLIAIAGCEKDNAEPCKRFKRPDTIKQDVGVQLVSSVLL
jgi:hypothetical protein